MSEELGKMNAETRLVDIKGIKAATGYGSTKVYELAKAGLLPLRKAGGRTVILSTDLDEYMRSLPLARF